MAGFRRALELYVQHYARGRSPVFVYSMQRTGTVAIFQSLTAHGVFALATHFMDPKKARTGHLSGSARWAYTHVIVPRKPAKIITLVRNPIENMMSVFARDQLARGAASADPSQQFITEFLESGRYREQLEWFESEFQVVTDVDVLQHPFDKERGHARIQDGPYEILILRTELEDDEKGRLVSDFLELKDFKLFRATSIPSAISGAAPGTPGDQAPYAEQYKSLKSRVRIPKTYFDAVADSRFCKHFFPSEELDATRRRFAG